GCRPETLQSRLSTYTKLPSNDPPRRFCDPSDSIPSSAVAFPIGPRQAGRDGALLLGCRPRRSHRPRFQPEYQLGHPSNGGISPSVLVAGTIRPPRTLSSFAEGR